MMLLIFSENYFCFYHFALAPPPVWYSPAMPRKSPFASRVSLSVLFFILSWIPTANVLANSTRIEPVKDKLRTWLVEQLQTPAWKQNFQGKGAIKLQWTSEVSTNLSNAELDQLWRQVRELPDHPARNGIQYQQRLKKNPETGQSIALYKDSSTWYSSNVTNTSIGKMNFENGGLNKSRWMMMRTDSMSQLTKIRAGVPFPSGYNVSRYLDILRDHLDLFLGSGMGKIGPDANIVSVKLLDDTNWNAAISFSDNGIKMIAEVVGTWDQSDTDPVVTVVRTKPVDVSSWDSKTLFKDYSDGDSSEPRHPQRIIIDRSDGLRTSYTLTTISFISKFEITKKARAPEIQNEDVTVLDFTTPDSSSWELYKNSSTVTWSHNSSNDSYIANSQTAKDPGAKNNQTGSKPGIQKHSHSKSFPAFPLLIVALTVAGILLLVSIVRRSS